MFGWYNVAIKNKDDGMKALLKKIQKVDPPVLQHLLREYIKRCRQKHTIAFLEWRLKYSSLRKSLNHSAHMKNEHVEAIITQLVKDMDDEFQSRIRNMKLTDKTIKVGANIPIK